MRDAREMVETIDAGEFALPLSTDPSTDVPLLSARQYQIVSTVLAAVLAELSAGAVSATMGDTSSLTYADGWAAASTLARIAAAGALFDSPR